LNLQNLNNGPSLRRDANEVKKMTFAIDAEDLNKKWIDNISHQLDSLLSNNVTQDEEGQA
jgi:hypothetical protein